MSMEEEVNVYRCLNTHSHAWIGEMMMQMEDKERFLTKTMYTSIGTVT